MQVDSTLAYLDTLSTQHKDVSQKSKALYNSCEQLVKEKDQLEEFADAIRVKLKFFDEFETVCSQVGNSSCCFCCWCVRVCASVRVHALCPWRTLGSLMCHTVSAAACVPEQASRTPWHGAAQHKGQHTACDAMCLP